MGFPDSSQVNFRDNARLCKYDAVHEIHSLSELPMLQQCRDPRFDSAECVGVRLHVSE